MNIFYLHEDPIQNAKWHVDKHVVKMVTEYAQLLSTAHRILDGTEYEGRTANNRRIRRWRLPDKREDILFKASHVNHPCNVWVRESKSNYRLMYKIYMACLSEYTFRYGKIHGSARPSLCLLKVPNNIKELGTVDSSTFRLNDFFNLIFEEGNPSGIKFALQCLNLCNDKVRLPLTRISEDLKSRISSFIHKNSSDE